MALTPQQTAAAQNTLNQIKTQVQNIYNSAKQNPSLVNTAFKGLSGAYNQLSSISNSFSNSYRGSNQGNQGGWYMPPTDMTPLKVTPMMNATDLSSMTGFNTPNPYIPIDPSSFVSSINVTKPKEVTPEEMAINQSQAKLAEAYGAYDELPRRYKQMQDQAGITSGLQELANVNRSILQKKLEFEATNKQIAGQTIPTPIILKQQEVNRSAAAAEISAYAAYAEGIRGNILLAQNLIEKAIDIEYKPITARIDYIKQELEYQYKDLDRKDQKQAQIVSAQLDIYKSQVMEFSKTKQSIMNNAMEKQAPLSDFIKIFQAQTPQELAVAGAKYIRNAQDDANLANTYSQIKERSNSKVGTNNENVDSWVDLIARGVATLTNVPSNLRNAVSDKISKSGVQVLDDRARNTIAQLSTAKSILSQLNQSFELIKDKFATNAFGRLTSGMALDISARTQSNTNAAQFQAFKEGILATLARAQGEQGVLTDQDVERARTNLPKLTDTRALAESKLKTLRGLFDEIENRVISVYTQGGIRNINQSDKNQSDPLGIR